MGPPDAVTKEAGDVNGAINDQNLTDAYRTRHPNPADTFSPDMHGAFSMINQVSGHKLRLNI